MLGSLTPLAQNDSSGGGLSILFFFLVMGAIFYMLLIRPQQRRQRAQRDLIRSLGVGDEVVPVGGLFGIIQRLDDETVTIEVAPGVSIRFARGAIARKMVYDEEGPDDASSFGAPDTIDELEETSQADGQAEDGPSSGQTWRQGPRSRRDARRKRGGEAGTPS